MCELGEVESEILLFVQKPEMFWTGDDNVMKWLFNFIVSKLANFVCKAWMRQQINTSMYVVPTVWQLIVCWWYWCLTSPLGPGIQCVRKTIVKKNSNLEHNH